MYRKNTQAEEGKNTLPTPVPPPAAVGVYRDARVGADVIALCDNGSWTVRNEYLEPKTGLGEGNPEVRFCVFFIITRN